MLQLTIDPTSF